MLAIFTVGTGGYVAGVLPATLVVAMHALGMYLSFTVLHEGMHGVAHGSRPVNDLLARIAGIPLTITLPLFRGVHYEHHSHTNDTERDPDLIVSWQPRWLLPLWCLGVMIEYRVKFFGHRLWRTRADLIEAIAMDGLLLAITSAAIAGGWWQALIVLWLAPAAIAVLFLAFAFDFLPHYPYDTTAPLLRHPHLSRPRAERRAARPELPPRPPPLDDDPVVPLPAGLRADRGALEARGCRIEPVVPAGTRSVAA